MKNSNNNFNVQDVTNFLLKEMENTKTKTSDWQNDPTFIEYFEGPRINEILKVISKSSKDQDVKKCLEIGFLNGLTPKSIRNFIPNSQIDIIERPECTIFKDTNKLRKLRSCDINIIPLDLNTAITNEALQIEKYDFIILGEVIEHLDPSLTRETLTLFNNFYLKPTGKLIITTPNLHSFWYRIRLLFGREICSPPIEDETMGMGHITIWSPKNLKDILKNTGYNILQTKYLNGMYDWDFRIFPKNFFSIEFYFVMINLFCKLMYKVKPDTGWTQIVISERQK